MMQNLRILQLIDSLETGGAERMAVNYANALCDRIAFSGLVATRKEGALCQQLQPEVTYLYLNKVNKIDFSALWRFRKFVILNRVHIVHAHSTSFFLAVLLKLTLPNIQIVWHDHYGNSEFLKDRPVQVLRLCSRFFSGAISVNRKLQDWAKNQLAIKNTIYLPNFVLEHLDQHIQVQTQLKGKPGKRILCLANLREQKGHFSLIKIAASLRDSHPDWTFHLVGKDFLDEYSTAVKQAIVDQHLSEIVFVYGSRDDIPQIIRQSSIGILTSHSEGLPVSLLEYGLFGLPVVATAVGQIPEIINQGEAQLVSDHDTQGFVAALGHLIQNEQEAAKMGESLRKLIYSTFVANAVVGNYLQWIVKTSRR